MNSCLYRAQVMHHRLEPKQHRFHYNVFMFYLDLSEIDAIARKFLFISRNKFNYFSFKDSEHLQLPREKPDQSKNINEHITNYIRQNGIKDEIARIMLLTNLNILGYNFNPVSFYFVFGKQEEPLCAIAEVSNTFGEMKPFFLGKEFFDGSNFHLNTKKYFYVSPFIEHDVNFDFNIEIPGEKMNIKIDDYRDDKRFFISTLTGDKKEMTNARLFWYSLRFPFITLQIISLIHWNAFRLWLKKIKYYKKYEYSDLQREIYKPNK